MSEKICGECKYNKRDWTNPNNPDFYCSNERSDYYGYNTDIENTIAMLERNGGYFADEWIITFKAELAYRDYIRRVVNENW